MKRSDLAGRVATEVSLSKADAEVAVNAVLEAISDALARGESVSVTSFGTEEFSVARCDGMYHPEVDAHPSASLFLRH